MELSIGTEVILTNRFGGVLAGVVDHFEDKDGRLVEKDGPVAIIMPTDPVMKAWYPHGYDLGRAHWDGRLTLVRARTR